MTTGENLNIDAGAAAPAPVITEDAAMEAVFDRLVTNNGADRGDGGKFQSPAAAEGA